MFKIWKLTLFFLLCLVIALGFNLPLIHLLPHVKLPDTIQVSGVDGTLLKGRAAEITIDGFPIRGVDYRYRPTCIPLLKVCYRIDYDRGRVDVAYDVLNGDTEVSQTRIDYPVDELMAYVPNPLVRPVGRLELVIDEASLVQGRPSLAKGRLIWRDLGINDDGIKIDIGDYQVVFDGNPEGYRFDIADLDASLDVSGSGEIKPDGQYELDVRIESETGIDPQVKGVLNLVARNTGYNKYRIQQTGRLPANVTRQLF